MTMLPQRSSDVVWRTNHTTFSVIFPHTLRLAAFGAVWLLLGCSHQPTTRAEMEQEFSANFGFPPDSGVHDYRCSVTSVGDSLATWFSFACSENTFERLHATGFQTNHPGDLLNPMPVWRRDIDSPNPNAPAWWPGAPSSAMLFWKEWHSSDGAGHYLYFWREAATGRVNCRCADWQ